MRLGRSGVATPLVFCLFVGGVALAASGMGSDNNFDLRAYHLYNAFAALNGKFGYDLFPTGMQTFFVPTTDLLFYAARSALNTHPALLNAVLSLPSGIGAFLAFCIAMRFLPRNPAGVLLAVLAAVIGVTGAAGSPTIATAATEMVSGCFLLGGLLILLDHADAKLPPAGALLAAGALFGIAAGFKLTTLIYGVAAAAALLLAPPGGIGPRLRRTVTFGVAAAAGALLIGGWWWLKLYRLYGNPLFPLLNNLFHSPFYDPVSMADNRFKPRDWAQTLFYPFYWATRRSHVAGEFDVRDPRFAAAYLAVAASALMLALRIDPDASRRRRTALFLVFFAVSYVMWLEQFGIFRYLAPIELLTGLAVLLPFLPLLRRPAALFALPVLSLAALVWLQAFTVRPDWGRVWGDTAVSVAFPPLPPDSLIVHLDGAPEAYVAAFAPPSLRFVGANNGIIHPGHTTALDRAVEAAIRGHQGPIWGMEEHPQEPTDANQTLAYYGLRRTDDCLPIRSNLDAGHLRLCRLEPAK
jgi:hypothetical protein